jgi:hypothetical protein
MPIMASLAELIASSASYADNYSWFVDLARNFHTIQESAFYSLRTFFIFQANEKDRLYSPLTLILHYAFTAFFFLPSPLILTDY